MTHSRRVLEPAKVASFLFTVVLASGLAWASSANDWSGGAVLVIALGVTLLGVTVAAWLMPADAESEPAREDAQEGAVAPLVEVDRSSAVRRREDADPRGEPDARVHERRPQGTRAIGLVAPFVPWTSGYFGGLLAASSDAASAAGVELRRESIDRFLEEDGSWLRRFDGLIVVNTQIPPDLKERLREAEIPVVTIMHEDPEDPVVCSIRPDYRAFADLVSVTIQREVTSAAVLISRPLSNELTGQDVDPYRKEKRKIFFSWAQECGLERGDDLSLERLSEGSFGSLDEGAAVALEIQDWRNENGAKIYEALGDALPRGTALVFLADNVACEFLHSARVRGVALRERRIRVTGFDNSRPAEWLDVSSVDHELDRFMRLAFDRIGSAIRDPAGSPRHDVVWVPTRLALRESSAW